MAEIIELLEANDEQAIELFLEESLAEIDNAAKKSGKLANDNVELLKSVVDTMEELETASHSKMGRAMNKLDELKTKKEITEKNKGKKETTLGELVKRLHHLEQEKVRNEKKLKEETKNFAERQIDLIEKEARMLDEEKRQEDLILRREMEEDRLQEAEWEARILAQENGHQEQALKYYNAGIRQNQEKMVADSKELKYNGIPWIKKYSSAEVEQNFKCRNDVEQIKYEMAIKNFEAMRMRQKARRNVERKERDHRRSRERILRSQQRQQLEDQLKKRKNDLAQIHKEIANAEKERKQMEATVKDMDDATSKKFESELELIEIDSNLRGIHLETTAQESIIFELQEAIYYINDLKQKWTKVQDFFHHITEKIQEDINVEMDKLRRTTEKSGSPETMSKFVKKKLIKNAWYIIHSSSVLECIASTFSKVSSDHFMPLADSFGSFLTYSDNAEATRALESLKQDAANSTASIRRILPEFEAELKILLDARIADFTEAIKEISTEHQIC